MYFLFVEEGSVDIEQVKRITHMEPIIYRQGANEPKLVKLAEDISINTIKEEQMQEDFEKFAELMEDFYSSFKNREENNFDVDLAFKDYIDFFRNELKEFERRKD